MGRRLITTKVDTLDTRLIPVSSIAHNPANRRTSYDTEAVRELAASINEVGLLQPLGVVRYEIYLTHYPQHEKAVGTADWVAIFGNQRLAALKLTTITEAPVHVIDRLARDDRLDDAMLIENLQRSALPPLEEAQAISDLVNRHKSQREVARRLGVTQAFVSYRLKLLNLHPELKTALQSGILPLEQARHLGSLPKDQQLSTWKQAQTASSDNAVITYTSKQESESGDNAVITRDHQTSINAVNTAVKTRPNKAQSVSITLGSPAEIAFALKKHLAADQLRELAQLITE